MSSAQLKVRRIHPQAKIPGYAHVGDAGLDLFSVDDAVILPNRSALIKTGVQLELPPNTEAQIRPRSGLALNHQVTVLNSPGTIDRGHRGEIRVILINHGSAPFRVYAGLKIAQLVVSPVLTVEVVETAALSASDRGDGFGSSGT